MYTLTIDTTAGERSAMVAQTSFSGNYPFGFVEYGNRGTSDVTDPQLLEFWSSVDSVLSNSGLTSADFIRAICATQGATVVGET